MTNPDLFRQIIFQIVRYDIEFLVFGIVDMEASGQELECISGKTVADSLEDIGDSPVGTGAQYGICIFSYQCDRQFVVENIRNDSFRCLRKESFEVSIFRIYDRKIGNRNSPGISSVCLVIKRNRDKFSRLESMTPFSRLFLNFR